MKALIILITFLTALVCADSTNVVMPEYDRKEFIHWIDEDRDCQNTRQEVLIEEAIVIDTNVCTVKYGLWYCLYDDTLIYKASNMDIDHVVPLKNAWISGAWKWSKKKKKMFANYLLDGEHLIAVSSRSNRSKGSKSPDQWMPRNKNIHKQYLMAWCKIKVKWGLTASKDELIFLKNELYGEDVVFPLLRKE
jgi:hypothetical protein